MSSSSDDEVRLYVGNISVDTTTIDSLTQVFSNFGGGCDVIDVFLPTNRRTGLLRGFAFVTVIGSMDVANKIIEDMDQTELDGQIIRVEISTKPRRGEDRRASPGGGGGSSAAISGRGNAFTNSVDRKTNSRSNEEPYAEIKPMATEFFQ